MDLLKILLIPFFLVPLFATGQEVFSDEEKGAFVEVYFIEKEMNTNMLSDIDSLLGGVEIDPLKYREYLEMKRKNVELPVDIQGLQKSLKELENDWATKKQEILLSNSIERKLDFTRYEAMKKKYREEISFNREMKPYFDHYFKSKENE